MTRHALIGLTVLTLTAAGCSGHAATESVPDTPVAATATTVVIPAGDVVRVLSLIHI